MAVTAWLTPGTVTADTGWNSISSAAADDGSYATLGVYAFSATLRTGSVKLVKGGVNSGNDKASENTTAYPKGGDTALNFGSGADLWGNTLAPADVNASNFGVAWADSEQPGVYLRATNFAPAIPTGSVIKGIEVEVQARQLDNGFSYSFTGVDVVRIRITYGTDHTIIGGGEATGMLLYEMQEADKLNKLFQFKIYNKGLFLGEWTNEVATEPEFKTQINTIGTHMPIKLGRSIDAIQLVPEQIQDESGDDFLLQDGDTLIGFAGAGTALGPDSDADVNYDVQVNAYYGGYDYLITQQGEPLVTQDYELLMVVDGAPEGRSLITGFVSKWKAGYNADEAINTNMSTYGWELNQLILETASAKVIDVASNNAIETFAQDAATETQLLRQTITAPSTGLLSSVKFDGLAIPYLGKGGPVDVTLSVYAGTAHSGTPLATATETVPMSLNSNSHDFHPTTFDFADYITLTNAQTYSLVLSAAGYTGEVYVLKGVYSGGSLSRIAINGTVTAATDDLSFEVNYAGGLTTVPFNSYDPGNIMKAIVDFAASKGAHIGYTAESIELAGTTVSYTFKSNTIAEAINKTLELAPADWYFYIDPADNILYFKARPTTPDHTFTLGRDIARFEIERDMEGIVNTAYFSGGGNPALFRKTVDQASLDAWRRGLAKLSDNRVTDAVSADIISEGHIERNNTPQYTATLVVAAANYDIETIRVGQLAALAGFGNFIDELKLLISEVSYKHDTATLKLGTLKPPVSKRLEDLKRNLDVLEQQNNPSSPA